MTFEHAEVVASLPRHHGDPFDRMIIAQAVSEGLTVVTADAIFERYDVALERVL
jgi:PIN domain nuclease of toxin-antitoxin system